MNNKLTMMKYMKWLFLISVILEIIVIIFFIFDGYDNYSGFYFTMSSLVLLQASLIYNSKFKLFK